MLRELTLMCRSPRCSVTPQTCVRKLKVEVNIPWSQAITLKFQSLSPRRLSPTGLSRISSGKVVPVLVLGRREAPKARRAFGHPERNEVGLWVTTKIKNLFSLASRPARSYEFDLNSETMRKALHTALPKATYIAFYLSS